MRSQAAAIPETGPVCEVATILLAAPSILSIVLDRYPFSLGLSERRIRPSSVVLAVA